MKKRFGAIALVMIIMLTFSTTALATAGSIYGAGTCHTGFTTSRYIDRNGSWNSAISVHNYYVIWDDTWEYDFYQLTYAKNGSAQLSDSTPVFTGYSNQNSGGAVLSNASTNRSIYDERNTTVTLYSNSASYSKIYLRINKPNDINYLTGSSIYNMKTWGWFTK